MFSNMFICHLYLSFKKCHFMLVNIGSVHTKCVGHILAMGRKEGKEEGKEGGRKGPAKEGRARVLTIFIGRAGPCSK